MTGKIEIQMKSDGGATVVKDIGKLEARVDQLSKAHTQMGQKSVRAVKLVSGSMEKLEKDYRDARKELKRMEIGTDEFKKQKKEVDRLAKSLDGANSSIQRANVTTASGFGVVSRFTSELTTLAGGLGAVTAIVASVKGDLDRIAKQRENARLAQVDFGQALASKTISNLAENEREAVGPLARNVNNELGVGAGAVLETIGSLRSSGAKDIIEAAEFLLVAGKAFPRDIAQQAAIAKAGLIEARATGNRNPQQVIGGIVAAQATSQTTSVEDFAKAFSANTASAVANLKLTPEFAREEAAIFSILEPKSAEVAATAQNSFFTQLEKFVPSEEKKTEDGRVLNVTAEKRQQFIDANVRQRIQLLEAGGNVLEQFTDALPETGRNAIRRRLNQSPEDAATFKGVRDAIGNDQQSARQLVQLQKTAQQNAAFSLAQGRREAIQESFLIENKTREAFQAEAVLLNEANYENARTGTFTGAGDHFGAFVERLVSDPANLLTSEGDAAQAQRELEFRANSSTVSAEIRQNAKDQLQILKNLEEQMKLQTAANERGTAALAEIMRQNKQPEVVKVEPVNAGPVESPVPAAGLP